MRAIKILGKERVRKKGLPRKIDELSYTGKVEVNWDYLKGYEIGEGVPKGVAILEPEEIRITPHGHGYMDKDIKFTRSGEFGDWNYTMKIGGIEEELGEHFEILLKRRGGGYSGKLGIVDIVTGREIETDVILKRDPDTGILPSRAWVYVSGNPYALEVIRLGIPEIEVRHDGDERLIMIL